MSGRPSGSQASTPAPSARPWKLAAIDGEQRDAADERGADVGAARGREEPGVLADVVVDPLEPLGRQWRAGRADRAESREVAAGAGLDARVHARGDVAGGGAEAGDAGALGEVPEHAHVRVAGVSVIEDDRRRGEQGRDEEVPHHPAGCREPEDPIALLGVDVEVELLQVLEEDPALPLHDRLRQARRAGRVEDPKRVVERHPVERRRRARSRGKQGFPCGRPLQGRRVRVRVEVSDQDRVLQRGHLLLQPGHRVEAVEVLAAVAVAVDREQHPGLDLREAVDHRAGAEVRRAARPDGPDRRGGQERDERLGRVRDVGDDPIAPFDAQRPEAGRRRGDLPFQLAPRERVELAQLGGVLDRQRGRVAVTEDVFRVVQLRALEPARAGHGALGQDPLVRARRADVEVVPDRAPELLQLRHRPAPELFVGADGDPALALQPAHVGGHGGTLDALVAGLPELLGAHRPEPSRGCVSPGGARDRGRAGGSARA